MIEVAIAFLIAGFLFFVSGAPRWFTTVSEIGGFAFATYLVILIVEWLLGKVKS